jgi:predicted CoA-binding protein
MAVTLNHDSYSDAFIRAILDSVRTIALVGASSKDVRPSFFVARYLLDKGYRVFPVNPGLGGQTILGQRVFESLSEIPEPIDMVDIFRSSDAVPEDVDEALALAPRPKVIWMQLGVRNDAAAGKAETVGMTVVMNRCPKIEYGRLSGEIAWMGVNSRVISSKRPILSGDIAQGLGLKPKTGPSN